MSHLFSPLNIGSLELENRIVIAPMCQYSAVDGNAQDWHLIHLGNLALSGAGMLIIEAASVSPEGRITPADLGLYSDENEAALHRVMEAVTKYSITPMVIQLAHAGRKASSRAPWDGGAQIAPDEPFGWKAVAPSALPHAEGEDVPDELDEAGMAKVCDDFVSAARRAVALGFQGIEVHMAHGYLLHQFLSPLANRRTDNYGGTRENRMRFPLEVFDAVKAAVPPEMPIWVRVSATDWVPGGWDISDTAALGALLKARGCAAIHVSSGGVSPKQEIPIAPGYQVPLAAKLKTEIDLPFIAVGLVTKPEHAEAILENGEADAIAVARGMLYDPRWPWHAAAALGAEISAPRQYWRSQPREFKSLFKSAKVGQR
ncbi:MAG: NADH:flavin oxidoreductase/NADH oxidase [Rhodobacteraceae bacterium]|nr:NADH:flavin oxidoreductase/NADH oxidase [Paracoccaceae bacterium]